MSEPSEVGEKEMLDVLERIEDETRDEIRVIKKGEWTETRLPLMEERMRAVASLRRLIVEQEEWRRRAEEMTSYEHLRSVGQVGQSNELYEFVMDIRDFDFLEKKE